MTDRWLRWYEGTIRDGKFRIVAEDVEESVATIIGIWAALLEDASNSSPRGTITKSLAWHSIYLQIPEERIGTVWNALERLDVVHRINDTICINNWHKRQFETDHSDPTSSIRKLKWKQRHSKSERFGTRRNAGERSGTPETETETDIKKDIDQTAFDRFWKAYPRRVGKKVAEKALAKALRETSIDEIIAAIARQTSSWTDPKFIPHPATWLNAGRWADDLEQSTGPPRRAFIPDANMPTREELERRYAERREDEGAAAEGPGVLAPGVPVRRGAANGMVHGGGGEQAIRGLARLFPPAGLEAICDQDD